MFNSCFRAFIKISLLLINISLICFADIHYVSKTGTSKYPYTSWETASDSIQKCVDICNNGDTVYVANGIYFENLVVTKEISLIGSSMDSTVINASQLSNLNAIEYDADGRLSNFHIIGKPIVYYGTSCIYTLGHNLYINNCSFEKAYVGIGIINSSSIIDNNIFNNSYAFLMGDDSDTTYSSFTNSIILNSDNYDHGAIHLDLGGSVYIANNIILGGGRCYQGLNSYYNKDVIIKNNIFAGFTSANVSLGDVWDTSIINNNVFAYMVGSQTAQTFLCMFINDTKYPDKLPMICLQRHKMITPYTVPKLWIVLCV